jgi:hypothetical protein
MRVYRSPLKLFVFGIVGVVLIAAAADVMFGHWVSTPPDNNEGVLTTRGQAQQRGDLLWGGVMLVTGVLLFGGSVTDLVRNRATVVVSDDGLRLTGVPDNRLIPWGSVGAISSGTIRDPYDGSIREQLIVALKPGAGTVGDPSGVTREADTVYIDAHDWSVRVTDVALAAQGAYESFLRNEAVKTYEPPSIVWEITVDQPETEVPPCVPDDDSVGGDE